MRIKSTQVFQKNEPVIKDQVFFHLKTEDCFRFCTLKAFYFGILPSEAKQYFWLIFFLSENNFWQEIKNILAKNLASVARPKSHLKLVSH